MANSSPTDVMQFLSEFEDKPKHQETPEEEKEVFNPFEPTFQKTQNSERLKSFIKNEHQTKLKDPKEVGIEDLIKYLKEEEEQNFLTENGTDITVKTSFNLSETKKERLSPNTSYPEQMEMVLGSSLDLQNEQSNQLNILSQRLPRNQSSTVILSSFEPQQINQLNRNTFNQNETIKMEQLPKMDDEDDGKDMEEIDFEDEIKPSIELKDSSETKKKNRDKSKERLYSQLRLQTRGYQQFYFFLYLLLLGFKIEIRREKIVSKCHFMRISRVFQEFFFYFQDTEFYEQKLHETHQTQKKGKDMYIFSCKTMALIIQTLSYLGFEVEKKGNNEKTFPVVKKVRWNGIEIANKTQIFDVGKEFWTKIIQGKYGNANDFSLTIDDIKRTAGWSDTFLKARDQIASVYCKLKKDEMIRGLSDIQLMTTSECDINSNMNYISESFNVFELEYSCDMMNGVQFKRKDIYNQMIYTQQSMFSFPQLFFFNPLFTQHGKMNKLSPMKEYQPIENTIRSSKEIENEFVVMGQLTPERKNISLSSSIPTETPSSVPFDANTFESQCFQ